MNMIDADAINSEVNGMIMTIGGRHLRVVMTVAEVIVAGIMTEAQNAIITEIMTEIEETRTLVEAQVHPRRDQSEIGEVFQ